MSITASYDRSAINSRGGSTHKASGRDATGAALSSPDTVHDWGEVKDSSFKDKTPLTALYNEANEKVATEQGNRETGIMCTLMQRDKDVIDSIRNGVRDSYHICMHELGRNVRGKVQRMFAFGQFDPDVEFKLPGGEIPLNFQGEILRVNAVSLTPGELSSWVGNTTALTATVTIALGDWCVIVETNT